VLRRRLVVAALAALGLAGVVKLATEGGTETPHRPAAARSTQQASSAAPGSRARFAYLAGQRSNRCNLQAAEILAAPPGGRLQGSCCQPMDMANYRSQVGALAPYRQVAEIPRDPYDIPVAVAKRLLRFRDTVKLTASQQATYRRAIALSREKGPCCCRCWRWEAFRGLSYRLIAVRGFSAPQLATLIEALDGCGGASPPPGSDVRPA
jgi:hypothetical protein